MAAYKLAVADVVRLSVFCVSQEQASENIFYYRVTATTAGSVTLRETGNGFNQAVRTSYCNLMCNLASYDGVKVEVPFVVPEPAYVYVKDASPGLALPPELPRQTSGLIHWNTGFAGRSKQGRTYVPFPATVDLETAGKPTASYVSSLGVLANNLSSLVTINGEVAGTAQLQLQVWSPKLNTGEDVILFTAKDRWATQRRRGAFGRANTPPS